jgi:formylglycine-generating enzyme required for sulfatase activity
MEMLSEVVGRAASSITLVTGIAWLAVVWLGVGAWLAVVQKSKQRGLAFVAAGCLIAAALLVATTSVTGRGPSIALDNFRLVMESAPYYAAALAAAAYAYAVTRASRNAHAFYALVLASAPAFALLLLLDKAVGAGSRRSPIPTLAVQPPAQPLTHTHYPGMVYVPAGPFIRGSLSPYQLQTPVGSPAGDEHPVRSVRLSGFFIDRTEVSNRQFEAFVAATGFVTDAERSGGGILIDGAGVRYDASATWRLPYGQGDEAVDALWDHPVVQVSWYDADAFCKWRGFDLPTEAQWEKAARGVDGRTFPWGDAFEADKANFCDASCPLTDRVHTTESDGYARTSPVDAFAPGASPYGALNMAGNVWEWTRDWYDHEYYRYASEVDPLGPDRAASRDGRKVVHGGAWTSEAEKLRAASRSFDDPREWRAFGVGFRCAATVTVGELER